MMINVKGLITRSHRVGRWQGTEERIDTRIWSENTHDLLININNNEDGNDSNDDDNNYTQSTLLNTQRC